MKTLLLIGLGLRRKPVRTTLTVLSVVLAFILFGTLYGITSAFDVVMNGMDPNRLRVQSRASYREPLPLAHYEQISRIPGVSNVGYAVIFDGYYQDATNSVWSYGISDQLFSSKPQEFTLDPAVRARLAQTRAGAVVGVTLAKKFGWKVGDSIPLTSRMWTKRDGTSTWTFEILGFYDVKGQPQMANEVYFNYDYLDQERVIGAGTVSAFELRAAEPDRIAREIDALFANSMHPSTTSNDRDWIRGQMKQVGDIGLLVKVVIGAAFFSLLFLTANSMMYSVRERIREIATLKAIGFSDRRMFGVILSEAVLVCIAGCLLGLLASSALFGPASAAMQAPISMPASVLVVGLVAALITAFLSSFVPALWAQRLSVIDALAKH